MLAALALSVTVLILSALALCALAMMLIVVLVVALCFLALTSIILFVALVLAATDYYGGVSLPCDVSCYRREVVIPRRPLITGVLLSRCY